MKPTAVEWKAAQNGGQGGALKGQRFAATVPFPLLLVAAGFCCDVPRLVGPDLVVVYPFNAAA